MPDQNQNQQKDVQKPQPAPAPVPVFNVQANTPRELMVKVAQQMLRAGVQHPEWQFAIIPKVDKKTQVPTGEFYALWNLDDSGQVKQGFSGITLTPEEADMLPTTKGHPVAFSIDLVLRQLTPSASVRAKLIERTAATATRNAKKADSLGDEDMIASINRRRAAKGLAPIKSLDDLDV